MGTAFKNANRTPQVGLGTRIDRLPTHPESQAGDPLLPYQIWKIRKSTIREFQLEAKAQGRRTIPSLIREELDRAAGRFRKRRTAGGNGAGNGARNGADGGTKRQQS